MHARAPSLSSMLDPLRPYILQVDHEWENRRLPTKTAHRVGGVWVKASTT